MQNQTNERWQWGADNRTDRQKSERWRDAATGMTLPDSIMEPLRTRVGLIEALGEDEHGLAACELVGLSGACGAWCPILRVGKCQWQSEVDEEIGRWDVPARLAGLVDNSESLKWHLRGICTGPGVGGCEHCGAGVARAESESVYGDWA